MLDAAVRAKLNILVSGGTGTGKTTLLNVLSAFIPSDERIITIEDAVELQLQQEHVVRLESRPPNIEGRGEITIRDLVRNSLRMRPDRIVVGEVRGAESLDMLQAMNTGHEGSISTLHANSPRDAIARLETLVLMAGMDLPLRAIREQIASAIDIIVQITRHKDGVRRITHITEVHGMEGDIITLQDAFTFDYSRRVRRRTAGCSARIEPTGVRPRFAERIADHGIPLPVVALPARPPRHARGDPMNPVILVGGIARRAARWLVIVFFVIAPPAPRVALRAASRARESSTSRRSPRSPQRTTAAVDTRDLEAIERGCSAPEELELAGIKSDAVAVSSSSSPRAASVLALLGVAARPRERHLAALGGALRAAHAGRREDRR